MICVPWPNSSSVLGSSSTKLLRQTIRFDLVIASSMNGCLESTPVSRTAILISGAPRSLFSVFCRH